MKLSHSLALALAALSASCQTAHAAHDARAAKAKISKIPFFTPSYGKDVEQEMMGITTRSDTFVDALYTAPEDGAEPMDLDSGDEWDGDDQFAMKRARTGKDITPKSGFDFKFLLNNMDAKADPCQGMLCGKLCFAEFFNLSLIWLKRRYPNIFSVLPFPRVPPFPHQTFTNSLAVVSTPKTSSPKMLSVSIPVSTLLWKRMKKFFGKFWKDRILVPLVLNTFLKNVDLIVPISTE